MRSHYIAMVIVVLGLPEAICRAFTSEEGPFEVHIYNVSNCVTEKPWFHANVTSYTSKGRSLLRGKIDLQALQQPLKNVKFNIQVYYVEDGKVKAFELKNQNCHNVLVRGILQAAKVRYNAQKCTIEPHSFEFSNLDVNKIVHTVTQSAWYGTVVIRFEIAVPTTSFFCLNINLQFVKI